MRKDITLIIRSNNQDARFKLHSGKDYIIGRSSQADIPLEDKKASRKHAVIKFVDDNWLVQDNGSTNGLYIGSKKVEQATLGSGDSFRIGNSQLLIEPIQKSKENNSKLLEKKSSRPAWFFPVLIGLLVALFLLLLLAVFLPDEGKKDKSHEKGLLVVKPVEEKTVSPAPPIQTENNLEPQDDSSLIEQSRDMALAREHYRVGLLFFDSGHLKRAIDQWDLAHSYDNSNTLVIKKLARALKDLDFEISKHYQAAKVHYKYLRYHEAEQEFMIVTELTDDKGDERYLDSLKKLEQIKIKK